MANLAYAAGLGLLAGLVPVYLGLLPLPLVRRLSLLNRVLIISFSAGILMFLFADVMGEAVTLASAAAPGPAIFSLGLILGLAGPVGISSWRSQARRGTTEPSSAGPRFTTAYMIAMGIGLHNFGEGLALGASSTAGQLALTGVLLVGFALHNGTEGMGITGPISDLPLSFRDPLLMGFMAGFPTILGSVVGSLAYSALLGALFFSVAAGALLYVTVELIRVSYSPRRTFLGIVAGILVMYATELLLSL